MKWKSENESLKRKLYGGENLETLQVTVTENVRGKLQKVKLYNCYELRLLDAWKGIRVFAEPPNTNKKMQLVCEFMQKVKQH